MVLSWFLLGFEGVIAVVETLAKFVPWLRHQSIAISSFLEYSRFDSSGSVAH